MACLHDTVTDGAFLKLAYGLVEWKWLVVCDPYRPINVSLFVIKKGQHVGRQGYLLEGIYALGIKWIIKVCK